ncbi:hypothetical protein C8R47DRAFT_1156871 [Mycena vitilis]|nr:hypothetical protein C8R47DRAFT_1156871 [Mycena vitilis]
MKHVVQFVCLSPQLPSATSRDVTRYPHIVDSRPRDSLAPIYLDSARKKLLLQVLPTPLVEAAVWVLRAPGERRLAMSSFTALGFMSRTLVEDYPLSGTPSPRDRRNIHVHWELLTPGFKFGVWHWTCLQNPVQLTLRICIYTRTLKMNSCPSLIYG